MLLIEVTLEVITYFIFGDHLQMSAFGANGTMTLFHHLEAHADYMSSSFKKPGLFRHFGQSYQNYRRSQQELASIILPVIRQCRQKFEQQRELDGPETQANFRGVLFDLFKEPRYTDQALIEEFTGLLYAGKEELFRLIWNE